MQDIVEKFFKPGKLVVDLFSGKFATAKMCLDLPRHRRFLCCEADTECFAASTEELVETYAKQILTRKLDIFGADGFWIRSG